MYLFADMLQLGSQFGVVLLGLVDFFVGARFDSSSVVDVPLQLRHVQHATLVLSLHRDWQVFHPGIRNDHLGKKETVGG